MNADRTLVSERHGKSTNGKRVTRIVRRVFGGRPVVLRFTLDTDSYEPQHHLEVEAFDPASLEWNQIAWYQGSELQSFAGNGPGSRARSEGMIDTDLANAEDDVVDIIEAAS